VEFPYYFQFTAAGCVAITYTVGLHNHSQSLCHGHGEALKLFIACRHNFTLLRLQPICCAKPAVICPSLNLEMSLLSFSSLFYGFSELIEFVKMIHGDNLVSSRNLVRDDLHS
jgi:hypothetical protein